jgi:iron complex outermembrane receptor protein
MKKKILIMALAACGCGTYAAEPTDSVSLENVTVTGVRSAADVRQLPFTVTTISKEVLNENYRQNILPTLTEQVPGLMVASRGVLGYGVSTGAAGGMTMRGLSSGAGQMMVLIDGHPQYNGVYGHSIADSYYSMMAERVEVLRGPASVLYGSNAMGGVINIVTDDLSTLRNGTQTTIGV